MYMSLRQAVRSLGEDLLFAYRKAKVDANYERVRNMSLEFAEYEADLVPNLGRLRQTLLRQPERLLDGLGDAVGYIPKAFRAKAAQPNGHFFSSNHRSIWPVEGDWEFREIGRMSVDVHVLSSL